MNDNEVHAFDAGTEIPRLLTIREVANILRIHPRTAYRLAQDGSLAAIRVGSQWRVTEEALHEYVSKGWRQRRAGPEKGRARQCKLPI